RDIPEIDGDARKVRLDFRRWRGNPRGRGHSLKGIGQRQTYGYNNGEHRCGNARRHDGCYRADAIQTVILPKPPYLESESESESDPQAELNVAGAKSSSRPAE